MKPGKLSPADLERLVFPQHGLRRADVLVRGGIGQDAAVVDFGDQVAVLSTDPITGAGAQAGWLAVHVGCNDVAAAGAEPVAVLLTILLAPETALADAETLMDDAHRAAGELGIEIVGGHSEITSGLPRSIVVVTALGRCRRDRVVRADRARPGDTILMTKWAGLEGTAILAHDGAARLRKHLPDDVVARARALVNQLSVVPEAAAAGAAGACAMHDATEGGVLGALAELAVASGYGVDVDLDRVPLLPETRAMCDALQIDPLGLVSSGVLIVVASSPAPVVEAVTALGCLMTPIGQIVEGPSVVRAGGTVQPLVAPARDALWDALERIESADV